MSSPAGLRPGPWRGLLPGAELVIYPSPDLTTPTYPAPIWVTLVIQKRVGLNRRIRTQSELFRPVKQVVTTTPKFPEAVAILRQSITRVGIQKRLRTKTRFIEAFGGNIVVVITKPKPIEVVSAVNKRKRFVGEVKFSKVFGKPTTKPGIQEPRVLIQAVKRARIKARVKIVLKKPVRLAQGVTTLYFPPPPVVVRASQKRRALKNRLVGKVKQLKPTRTTPTLVSFPEYIAVVQQTATSKRAYIKRGGKVKLGKRFGRATTKPGIRPIRVLKFVAQIAERKAHYIPVNVVLGDVPRTFSGGTPCPPVTTYDALWVADGLTYHHGISRPTITLVPCPSGGFDVVVTGSLSDMRPDLLSKETVSIDGELP